MDKPKLNLLKIISKSFWVVVVLRIVTALYIFINPWWGWVLSGIMDMVDGQVWPRTTKISPV